MGGRGFWLAENEGQVMPNEVIIFSSNVQNLAEIEQLAFMDFKYFQKKNFDSPILKIFWKSIQTVTSTTLIERNCDLKKKICP